MSTAAAAAFAVLLNFAGAPRLCVWLYLALVRFQQVQWRWHVVGRRSRFLAWQVGGSFLVASWSSLTVALQALAMLKWMGRISTSATIFSSREE